MSDISNKDFQFIDINTIQAERITAPRYSYWASVFRVFFRKKVNIILITLFIILMIYYFKFAKGNVPPGRTSGIMITTIFASRFFIEFLKADQVAKEADMALNIGQKLSIPLTLLGIGLLIYSIVKKEKTPHYVEPEAPKKK